MFLYTFKKTFKIHMWFSYNKMSIKRILNNHKSMCTTDSFCTQHSTLKSPTPHIAPVANVAIYAWQPAVPERKPKLQKTLDWLDYLAWLCYGRSDSVVVHLSDIADRALLVLFVRRTNKEWLPLVLYIVYMYKI